MTSVEHTSLRENLVQLQQEFERLDAEDKLPAEVCVLIEGMFRSMEMMATLLEHDTPNTSANSSLDDTV